MEEIKPVWMNPDTGNNKRYSENIKYINNYQA